MDPSSAPLARWRRGNALMLVLGIALLLGIQVYIVHKLTVGSFRHVESVNAHIRAIYVGESGFSQILAKLKADTWENRWFKGREARDFNQPVAGGTYSSVVVEVAPPPPPAVPEKLVDVWIESRYEGSTALMYNRVLVSDDRLDFTAQVYPRFFTFLEQNDPNPFSGATPPAVLHIQDLIRRQGDNEAAAVAAIEGVKSTCNLAGVGSSIGIAFPAAPLDTLTPPGGAAQDLCSYVNGVNSTLAGLLPPPPALPLPPLPVPLLASNDFIQAVHDAFRNFAAGAKLPTNPGKPIDDARSLALFASASEANKQWNVAHQQKRYGHYMKEAEMLGFIGNLLDKRGALPALTADAIQIDAVVVALLGWVSNQSTTRSGPAYTAPTGTKAEYIAAFLASADKNTGLPSRSADFQAK